MKINASLLFVAFAAPGSLMAMPARLLPAYFKLPGFSTIVEGSVAGDSDLKGGGAFSTSTFDFAVAQEIPLGDGNGLSVGLGYGRIDLDQSGKNARTPLPDELQSLTLDLAYEHRWGEAWSVLAGISPNVANAGSGFDSDGFGVGGVVMATWRYRPEVALSFGLGYDSLTGDVGPALGVAWQIAQQWSFLFGYPDTALVYAPTEAWSFSLLAEGVGGSYHVADDPAPGAVGRPVLSDSTLSYADLRLGFAAGHRISQDVFVRLTVGYVLESEFEYEDPKYKVKSDGGAAYAGLSATVTF